MHRFVLPSRLRPFVLFCAAAITAAAGACSDNLTSSVGCPALCPGQVVTLRDTVLDAVVLDSSVAGFPSIGQETYLLISTRGDTLDSRGVFRFDSLPTTFTRKNAPLDSAIKGVDSVYLVLRVDTTLARPGAPVTVSVYDVDTGNPDSTVADTSVALLAPLFTPSRLLGSVTVSPDSLLDSLRVPMSSDSLFAYISSTHRMRVGVQVTGPNRAQLRVGTSRSGTPATLVFKPAARGDTVGVTPLQVALASSTPVGSPIVTGLEDFLLVVGASPATAAPVLAVGGLPGRRVYIRFNLPSQIVDSATVVRATLELNQVPNPLSPDARDTSAIWPQALLASAAVTDLDRALSIISNAGDLGLDTLERFAPADSGLRQFEMVQLVRTWRASLHVGDPTALALRASLEGVSGAEFWFTSSRGPSPLRPRIHITYTPRPGAEGGR